MIFYNKQGLLATLHLPCKFHIIEFCYQIIAPILIHKNTATCFGYDMCCSHMPECGMKYKFIQNALCLFFRVFEGKWPLDRRRYRWKDNIKNKPEILRLWRWEMNSSCSQQGQQWVFVSMAVKFEVSFEDYLLATWWLTCSRILLHDTNILQIS